VWVGEGERVLDYVCVCVRVCVSECLCALCDESSLVRVQYVPAAEVTHT